MLNKSYLSLWIILMFFIGAGQIFALQNDFYGTWEGNAIDEGVVFQMKYTFSTSVITVEVVIFEDNDDPDIIKEEAEILSWLESFNSDNCTMNDFPNGFILQTRSSNGIISSQIIYISRDKRRFIFPSFTDNDGQVIIFYKK